MLILHRAQAPVARWRQTRFLRVPLSLILASGLTGQGCSQDGGESRAAKTTRRDTVSASVSATVASLEAAEGEAERSRQLVHIAAAAVGNYEPLEGEHRGSLTQGRAQDHMLLLRYGRCYRILAVGGSGLNDLDLALYDRDQVERLRDLSSDRYPMLGVAPSLCPNRTDAYRLEVRAQQGAGSYTVGVWQSPL